MNHIWNAMPEWARRHTHNFLSWLFFFASTVLMGLSALMFFLLPTTLAGIIPAIVGFTMFSLWAWANK